MWRASAVLVKCGAAGPSAGLRWTYAGLAVDYGQFPLWMRRMPRMPRMPRGLRGGHVWLAGWPCVAADFLRGCAYPSAIGIAVHMCFGLCVRW